MRSGSRATAPRKSSVEHFSRFYTEQDRRAGAPQLALETAARDGRFEKEGWRIRKDGSQFMANVVIDPIRADDGTLLGFAKITRDITERKKSERALQEAREALFQSQKMDAIGQLTGGVAHDFNNLLMAVLGSLELLRKRLPDDPKTMRLVDNAMHAAQRGAGLTQRMLAFARRQELKPVVLDVADLVRGMTDLLHSSLGATAQIRMDFASGLHKVLADPNQLELAILNLAVNARDAMPKGGSIVITAKEETVAGATDLKDGRYVCLSVTDNGTGMDEATRRRALEPFFTTKGVGKGTGLGLSMVHGMIQQSGGKFVLKSSKGEGTTAELWLPVAAADADHVQERGGRRSRSMERKVRLSSSRWMTTRWCCSIPRPCWKTSATPCWRRRSGKERPRNHPAPGQHRPRDHRSGHAAHDRLGSRRGDQGGKTLICRSCWRQDLPSCRPARTKACPSCRSRFCSTSWRMRSRRPWRSDAERRRPD